MIDSTLNARDIRKKYGELEVLRGVNLEVLGSETFAIIGPNGAGKTTLFKILTGETLQFTGAVFYEGQEITKLPSYQRARLHFGRTFQVARIFGELSVLTNIVLAIETRRTHSGEPLGSWWKWRPSAEIQDEALDLLADVGLHRDVAAPASLLSHGDKKRLEFALALAGRPKILFLDEPTAGMSAEDRKSMTLLLQKLKERKVTIVMTEHDMDLIFGIADRIMVLNYGSVVCIGTPQDVRYDETVKQVYLGRGEAHAHN